MALEIQASLTCGGIPVIIDHTAKVRVKVVVFSATFNNISVILWQ